MKKSAFFSVLAAAGLSFSMVFATSCGKTAVNQSATSFLDEPVEVKPVAVAGQSGQNTSGTSGGNNSTGNGASGFIPATTGIGEAFVVPNRTDDLSALAGTNIITFFFSNPNVTSGTGLISVFEKDSPNSLASINTGSSESVTFSEISDYGKSVTGWSYGRQADIYLPVALDPSKEYFVLLEKNAFSAGTIQSAPVLDKNIITFSTKAYGLGKTVLPDRVAKGTSISIPIILGTGAVSASIEKKAGSFRINPDREITSSGTYSVTFTDPGVVRFSIVFKSAASAVVDTIPVEIVVV